jgi:hypothetical protein
LRDPDETIVVFTHGFVAMRPRVCVAFVDERRIVAGGLETLIQSARTEPRRRLSMLEDVER